MRHCGNSCLVHKSSSTYPYHRHPHPTSRTPGGEGVEETSTHFLPSIDISCLFGSLVKIKNGRKDTRRWDSGGIFGWLLAQRYTCPVGVGPIMEPVIDASKW